MSWSKPEYMISTSSICYIPRPNSTQQVFTQSQSVWWLIFSFTISFLHTTTHFTQNRCLPIKIHPKPSGGDDNGDPKTGCGKDQPNHGLHRCRHRAQLETLSERPSETNQARYVLVINHSFQIHHHMSTEGLSVNQLIDIFITLHVLPPPFLSSGPSRHLPGAHLCRRQSCSWIGIHANRQWQNFTDKRKWPSPPNFDILRWHHTCS